MKKFGSDHGERTLSVAFLGLASFSTSGSPWIRRLTETPCSECTGIRSDLQRTVQWLFALAQKVAESSETCDVPLAHIAHQIQAESETHHTGARIAAQRKASTFDRRHRIGRLLIPSRTTRTVTLTSILAKMQLGSHEVWRRRHPEEG